MASKQIRCEMCCNENAVGYCKTCGFLGETCVNIHKIGKIFQTHTLIMHEAVKVHEGGTENPKVILRDITEERCKQHPTERVIFLCNIHDSVICGRCLHSEHLSCGKEVVDLLHEVVNIDCEKVNTMQSVLKEVKDEILFLKDEVEQSMESYKKHADKCMQECMELGNKIKRRVDELTSDIIHGITKTNDINVSTHSSITQTCNEKTKWCEDEENKIDDFVDNNMAGHLYLMHRHFEKEVSDARSHLKEMKHKQTFKGFGCKENKVILKCLFEDLEEVCEHQEEVTGSDDGNLDNVVASPTKICKTRREFTALLNQIKQDLDKSEKTRREHTALLNQIKQDLDQSEKARNALSDELKQVKQSKDNSEKKRKIFEQELEKAKQDIEDSEKTRKALCGELQKVKQDIDNSEKTRRGLEQKLLKANQDIKEAKRERAEVKAQCSQIKDRINWTQPTGTVNVTFGIGTIDLVFKFPDGILTCEQKKKEEPRQIGGGIRDTKSVSRKPDKRWHVQRMLDAGP
ncbi:myosin-11-like isoform X2 [Mya arenaria]|uniref:myosin-11-like isoform X2 n=1 Tax=Mya arenaria TaxID=6604 RepID=UPI0022DFBC5F|nr:myosin-11-like isoform X2 [Mya arenaria]